ncbi:MAG: type II toxin-antitoxin system HigB family toxin [Bacteroidia bacterium]|nr:type II toxin-antitoxin system HigB family toxin [Bacteroidia bacterium]
MILTNIGQISSAQREHSLAHGALSTLRSMLEKATWKSVNDLKYDYPSASIIPNKNKSRRKKAAEKPSRIVRVVFNIKGNQFRLVAAIQFASDDSQGHVHFVWFGTHAEYDKIDVSSIRPSKADQV